MKYFATGRGSTKIADKNVVPLIIAGVLVVIYLAKHNQIPTAEDAVSFVENFGV